MPRKPAWPPRVIQRGGKDIIRIQVGPGSYVDRTLGPTGSPEARKEYLRLVAELEANDKVLPVQVGVGITVVELAVAYLQHQKGRLDPRDYHRVSTAVKTAADLYGDQPASAFGPVALRAVRDRFVAHPYCRRLCNQMTTLIRGWFRWCASHEMIPASVALALNTLEPLRKRQTSAPDHPPIRPVADEVVDATLPHLSVVVGAMVRLQRVTGMRPGEVCAVRCEDIDREWRTIDGVPIWLFVLDAHKNEWRGHSRQIPLGPAAQVILSPFMDRVGYCFSPRAAYLEKRRIGRRRKRPSSSATSGFAKDIVTLIQFYLSIPKLRSRKSSLFQTLRLL